jgi:peptide/nickel transport system substrate-binding protein
LEADLPNSQPSFLLTPILLCPLDHLRTLKFAFLFFAGALLLTGCSLKNETTFTPIPIITVDTPSPTAFPLSTTALWVPTTTPEPTPEERTLIICTGSEPDSLYLYSDGMLANQNLLEAIYDGPIDTNGFDYQPVIFEKLPDLADGDAQIEPVQVTEGDLVVNVAGGTVSLTVGEKVRPYGCNQPECALTWDGGPIEMAQLSADFTLLDGIYWSDGEPLTADDSTFSYEIARECVGPFGNKCGGLGLAYGGYATLENTANYISLDERTTRWIGLPGYLDPNYRANFFHPLPEHQLHGLSPKDMFEAKETRQQPMGWGPYVIDEWTPGDHIRLHKNPIYFRAVDGLPKFENLVYRFIGENSNAAIDAVLAGECDIIDQTVGLDDQIELLLELQRADRIDPIFSTGTVWEHVDFSIQHADYDDGYQMGRDRPDFFGEVRMRQAMILCMDRQKVVDEVLFGRALVLDTYLPPEHPLYNPEIEHYSFNPIEGSNLLAEMGWSDDDHDPTTPRIAQGVPNILEGTPLSFTYTTTPSTQRQQAAQTLAASLAYCGIEVNLEFIPVSAFFGEPPEGAIFSRHFDVAEFAWATGVQPPCQLYTTEEIPGDPQLLNAEGKPRFPRGWEGQNEIGYNNPEYDQVCHSAKATLPGQPGYVANHHKAQEILAADLPFIPLYQPIKAAAARADMCGYKMDPTARSDTWNIEAFDYGEGCK